MGSCIFIYFFYHCIFGICGHTHTRVSASALFNHSTMNESKAGLCGERPTLCSGNKVAMQWSYSLTSCVLQNLHGPFQAAQTGPYTYAQQICIHVHFCVDAIHMFMNCSEVGQTAINNELFNTAPVGEVEVGGVGL